DSCPTSYDDVYHCDHLLDGLVGVSGTKENLNNEPDGIFLKPPKPRLHELMIAQAGKKVNIPVIPSRLSILTEPINNERGVCFYCRQCGRACQAYADFSSSSVLVIPAMKTGNLHLINNAMAREVITDPQTGMATGVSYVDTQTLTEQTVNAKVVIL